MDSQRFQRLRQAFEEAVDLDGAAREAVIRTIGSTDPSLATALVEMLRTHERSDTFLSTPAMEMTVAGELRRAPPGADALIGGSLGHFHIEGVLGRGGMGVVYRARQERPRREVALKLIRPGALGPSVLRRFEHESQILGRLKHPGIAQVYEAGTLPAPDGEARPYFAMELVEGRPLLEHAREQNLGQRERIGLLCLVCDAVEHAHQKGVIHRDLKPANILVEAISSTASGVLPETLSATTSATLSESAGTPAAGRPKVLDFGVARLTDSDLATTTLQTTPGQVIGTLQYMSPEQVRGATAEIDTRSDVYALCVILFELLTGRLPHDIREKPIGEAARIITEQPPTRLGSIDRSLRGDLDTIVHKALSPEPSRRYPTAAALATDLRRLLADLPILARRPSAAYQARKFAARNKVLVGGVAAVFLALAGGVVGISLALVRARAAESDAIQKAAEARTAEAAATKEAENSRAVSLFILNLFSKVHPGSFERNDGTTRQAETVDQLLIRGSESIERYTKGKPEVETLLLRNFGDALRSRGELDRAEALLRRCEAIERGMGTAGSAGLVITLQALGRTLDDRGDGKAAARAYHEALDVQLASGALDPTHGWMTMQSVATAHWRAGEFGAARALYDRLFETVRTLPEGPAIIAQAKNNLAGLYVSQGMFAEAEPIVRQAIEGMRALAMKDMRDEILTAEGNYAWLLLQLDRPQEALALARRVLTGKREIFQPGHLKLAKGELGLAQALLAAGNPAEALPLLESALPVYRARAKPGTSTALEAEAAMGECLVALDRTTEARAVLEAALGTVGGIEGLRPLEASTRASLIRPLARVLRATGELTRAAELEALGAPVPE